MSYQACVPWVLHWSGNSAKLRFLVGMMVLGGSLLLWSHGPNSADARIAVDKVDGHLKIEKCR